MRRTILIAATLNLAACSVLGMTPLEASYDRRTLPRCETNATYAVADLAAAVGHGSLAVALTVDNGENSTAGAITNVVLGLVFVGSSVAGFRWSSACKAANAQWDQRQIEQDEAIHGSDELADRKHAVDHDAAMRNRSNPQNDPAKAYAYWCGANSECVADEEVCRGACQKTYRVSCAFGDAGYLCATSRAACLSLRDESRKQFGECVPQVPALPEPAHIQAARIIKAPNIPPTPPPPRGFYCSSSPTNAVASFCTREKAECSRAYRAAVTAVTDLTECTLVESTFCFGAADGPQCSATQATCQAQVLVAPPPTNGQVVECTETK